MPGGMELDHVAAMAEAVEALQQRRMAVRLEDPVDGLRAAEAAAESPQAFARPAAALARDGVVHRPVAMGLRWRLPPSGRSLADGQRPKASRPPQKRPTKIRGGTLECPRF